MNLLRWTLDAAGWKSLSFFWGVGVVGGMGFWGMGDGGWGFGVLGDGVLSQNIEDVNFGDTTVLGSARPFLRRHAKI